MMIGFIKFSFLCPTSCRILLYGLLGLHSLQLFCELFHGKVIVGADTAPACGADLVQQLFNFSVLPVVAIPGGVLLGLFRHGEIAAPSDQNRRHTGVNGVALVEVFRQPAGVAVNKGVDLMVSFCQVVAW